MLVFVVAGHVAVHMTRGPQLCLFFLLSACLMSVSMAFSTSHRLLAARRLVASCSPLPSPLRQQSQQQCYYQQSSPSYSVSVFRLFSSSSGPAPPASLVKELREKSNGAPLLECKSALSHTYVSASSSFDIEAALKHLRTTGSLKIATKTASRAANEGCIAISTSPSRDRSVAVSLGCETDFAAKGTCFTSLAGTVAHDLLSHAAFSSGAKSHADLPAVLDAIPSIKAAWSNAALTVRENLTLNSAVVLSSSSPSERLYEYVHGKISSPSSSSSPSSYSVGSSAAIVRLTAAVPGAKTIGDEDAVGRQLAMHVVAARPRYLSIASVPPDAVSEERRAILAQTSVADEKFDKKPEEIKKKIVEGKLSKFYQATVLEEQEHMVDSTMGEKLSVKKVLEKRGFKCTDFLLVL